MLAGAAMLCHLCVQETMASQWVPRGLFRSRKQTLHPAKMV